MSLLLDNEILCAMAFSSHMAYRVELISDSSAVSQTPAKAASHGVPVYHLAYAGTKFKCLVTEARVREWLAQGRSRYQIKLNYTAT